MTHTSIHQRQGLPEEMQILLRDYPRDAWPDNPHFARSIQNWMGAHEMFRRLGDINRKECENYLDDKRSAHEFAARLSHYGGLLVQNLHGHHTWEDRDFFPELSRADSRFDQGLETLESDHVELNKVLELFTSSANRVIKLAQLDENLVRDEVGQLHDCTEEIKKFLARHLRDEEDLVVPIIIHHKLRG